MTYGTIPLKTNKKIYINEIKIDKKYLKNIFQNFENT